MKQTNPYQHVFSDAGQSGKNITIDLAARYAAAFGMMAVGRLIDKAFVSLGGAQNDYSFDYFPEMSAETEYVKFEISDLEPLEFSSILNPLPFGEGSGAGKIFAPPLMLAFSQEKNLVETEVSDSDPIIVERWGTKAWDVSIKGLLIDLENRVYPSGQIRRLNQNWKYNGVVKVVGQQFEEKDIDSIYFKKIEFSAIEGFQDTIQFSIEASSIKSVNFTLLKPN